MKHFLMIAVALSGVSVAAENLTFKTETQYELQAQAIPEFRVCNNGPIGETTGFYVALARLGQRLVINKSSFVTDDEAQADGSSPVNKVVRKTLNQEMTSALKDRHATIVRTSSHIRITSEKDIANLSNFIEQFGAVVRPDLDSHCLDIEMIPNSVSIHDNNSLDIYMTQVKFWDTLSALRQDQ